MYATKHTRDVFLLCMSVIYLTAFTSLYIQIPGLYGDNGILPAKLVLSKESDSWEELLEGQPTLLKLTPKLGLSIQNGMDLLCLVGMAVSFMCVVCQPMRDCVSFTLLWMLYLSLYQVGQTFLSFQWDILLLETGFLTILVAPFNLQIPIKRFRFGFYHQHDNITLWLIRWLLFRLMFASGVVKLTSKCPTWWGLTALNWHFESQCIPTPVSWYFHHMPVWFLKLSTVATFAIEIAIPFLFFSPVRSLRLASFWFQILLQVLIITTGNYNFFNLLTIALCVSLLDDRFLGTARRQRQDGPNMVDFIATIVAIGYILYQTAILFSLELTTDFSIESKVAFTEKDLNHFLDITVPITIYIGAASLGFEIIISLVRCFTEEKGTFWKNWAAVQCLFYGVLAAALFSISLIPYTTVHKNAQELIPKQVFQLRSIVNDFHLSSSYGLFRRMTGVGGRPEVIIEGSNDREIGWKEYEFLYKPGKLSRRPPFVAPHQPRLDWQMWFAALGSYQHNPWFLHLMYRLLTNQPEVLQLIEHNPFPGTPPKYIRASLYTYHYTNATGIHRHTSNWWKREKSGEYLPVLTKDDSSLVKYLQHAKILDSDIDKKKRKKASPSFFSWLVTGIRGYIGQPEGFTFVMSVLISAIAAHFLTDALI